ncbi:MAG: metal-dependent hydrolase [Acidobacteria bacterium]|nr:metal-dependent hydrolase [Acidobacteriota bacterium]
MPSPVGHAIGGLVAGWGAAGHAPYPAWIRQALVLVVVGMLPDIDLLFGWHSGPTHSVGAALLAGAIAWGARRAAPRSAYAVTPLAVTCAYASHILLDWLGADTSAPFGVMALWPLTDGYFMSPIAVMPSITRRYWLTGFWEHNLRALMFELVLLVPLLLIVWWTRAVRSAR